VNCLVLTLAIASFGAPAPDTRPDTWPEWRGPDHDGASSERGIAAEWGPEKNVAWKLALPGMGSATPAVWGDRIFVTSASGSDLVLLCINTSGKELWRRTLGVGQIRARGDEGNGASASPCTDGKLVFAYVGTGDLACFDFDGKQVWKFNVQERYGRFKIMFGMHATPVLFGDRLYLALLHSDGHWVIALDKTTGSEVWKVERESDGKVECEQSYASPMLWQNGTSAYLVVHGNDYTTGHRLDDGKELWRLGDLNPKERYNSYFRFVASPGVSRDLIVVPTAKRGPVVGVKPDATGFIHAGDSGEQWRRKADTPDVPCPLIYDGIVYLCDERGTLTAIDGKTGKEIYSQPLHRDRYRASPVYADGKVYLTSRDGTVTVVKAGRTFEKIAENKLNDPMTASPAVAGGRIYLRGFSALYAIGRP
jgi:outer membrane protein assembly factor BamB